MSVSTKTTQLQIRITALEKTAILRAAQRLNMDMSSYVLARVLPQYNKEFQTLINDLVICDDPRFVLSEINTLVSRLTRMELKNTLSIALPNDLSNYLKNYLAAMVEYVCHLHQVSCPSWIKLVTPLEIPVFASELQYLRLYLLMHSPPPFRRRNIFIDTTIGGQV